MDVSKESAEYRPSPGSRVEHIAQFGRSIIWSAPPDFSRIDNVTSAFEEIWGIPSEAVHESPEAVFQAIHPDDREAVVAAAVGAPPGDAWTVKFRVVRPDGSERWVEVRAFPVVVEPNGDDWRGGFGRDITDRVLAADRLAQTDELFADISRLSQIGEWSLDPETFDPWWSDELYRIYGLPQGQIPAVEDGIGFYHPDDQPKIAAAVQAALDDGVPYDLELRLIPADGGEKWVRSIGNPVVEHGKTVNLWGSLQDISRMREMEHSEIEQSRALQRSYVGAISSMARIIESRDPYTAGHQQRVSQLSESIARELRWDPDRVEGVRFGAILHDIGKIAVPAEILTRPGKLTSLEFEMIKNHVTVGLEIISDTEFPWPVAEIVSQHHERLDGSGYPHHLVDGEISLEARLVAVADVVEAMSSHRPYRAALGIDAALEEIRLGRATLFDPDVVDACLGLFSEGRFEFSAP